jgi:hypothetical protein
MREKKDSNAINTQIALEKKEIRSMFSFINSKRTNINNC